MVSSRERRILVATALCAVGLPTGAALWVDARTEGLATRLGAAAGVPARIGTIEADLTGRLRLSDVGLGELFAADRIEASVGLESLLAGHFGADEVRVFGPRVALEIDRDGDSDLARVVRRLASGRASGPHVAGGAAGHAIAHPSHLPRIVVSSGTLSARIAGVGELVADAVELVPDVEGLRMITGRLHVRAGTDRLRGDLELERSAAEIALPHVRFGRVLAVAGTGRVTAGNRTIAFRDLALGRLATGGPLEIRASLDDGGIQRQVSAELAMAPTAGGDRTGDLALSVHVDRVPLHAFAQLAPHAIDIDGARASGSLVLHRQGSSLQVALDTELDNVRLDHRTIGAQPIPFTGKLRGNFTVAPESIAADHVAIEVGAARWTVSGWLRRGQPVSGQLDLGLAEAPCADLMASLPAELRGPLDGMTMTGTFGGHAHLGVDLAAPLGDGVALDVALDNRCVVAIEPAAADASVLAGPSDTVFADGSRAVVGRGTPSWVELHRVPSFVYGSFVSAEDGRFFDHHGFDTTQIAKSFEIDLRDHRLARGGSTISQQLVKNAFLTQRRSLDRKIQEAILTWRLESRLDKKTILERYLNVIELGPHTFGIRAAAQHWFGESPRELSVRQAAFLAALTSEPQSMSRRVRHAGTLDPDSAARVDIILRAMRRDGVIDNEQLEHARATQLWFSPAALARDD